MTIEWSYRICALLILYNILSVVTTQFLGFTFQICSKSDVGVNLNCIDVYAVLERANDRKLHVFATKHEANTYSEHLFHYHDDVSI